MKRVWASGLGICLALCGWTVTAEDFSWRPVVSQSAASPASSRAAGAAIQVVEADSSVPPAPGPRPQLLRPRAVVRGQNAEADATAPNQAALRVPAPAVPFPTARNDLATRLAEPPPPLPPPQLGPPIPAGMPAVLPRVDNVTVRAAGVQRVSCGSTEGVPDTLPPAGPGEVFRGNAMPPLPPCEQQACCDPACCPCEADCRSGPRFWARAEYLLWDVHDTHAPPLVTTGPNAFGTFLNSGQSVTLFGGDIDTPLQSGGRFTAGYWFDCCETNGIQASYFFLGQRAVNFDSGVQPVLSRPFFNIATGMEFVETVSQPNTNLGRITVDAPSKLWGAETDWRHNLLCGCWYRVDLLAGFRYVDLEEGLHITEDYHFLPGVNNLGFPFPFTPGTHVVVSDRFDTRNQFYGGQVGFETELHRGRWSLDLSTKVALGDNHETVDIGGNFITTPPGGSPTVHTGGLLALSSNIGHYTRDRFAVVPELGATLGYNLTDNIRVFAGYNFLFWSNVVRPAEQIDRNINPALIPTFCQQANQSPKVCPPNMVNVQRPLFEFHDTTFWAQGLTAGMQFTY
jgi:hypothetical protein